jgi:hypothetical protein
MAYAGNIIVQEYFQIRRRNGTPLGPNPQKGIEFLKSWK